MAQPSLEYGTTGRPGAVSADGPVHCRWLDTAGVCNLHRAGREHRADEGQPHHRDIGAVRRAAPTCLRGAAEKAGWVTA